MFFCICRTEPLTLVSLCVLVRVVCVFCGSLHGYLLLLTTVLLKKITDYSKTINDNVCQSFYKSLLLYTPPTWFYPSNHSLSSWITTVPLPNHKGTVTCAKIKNHVSNFASSLCVKFNITWLDMNFASAVDDQPFSPHSLSLFGMTQDAETITGDCRTMYASYICIYYYCIICSDVIHA